MPAADRPIRVLHLLGRPPDYQTARAVEPLSRGEALSGGATLSAASARGAVVDRVDIGPRGRWRNLPVAVLGLRRLAGDLDLVHCWDEQALVVAAFAGARRVVYSPQAVPDSAGVRWLRAVMGYRDVQVVCPSTAVRRHLVGRGVPLDRCHLARPGVDFARVRRRPDAALRAALGLAPDDFVLLAPGESTDPADHFLAVWAASILHVLDDRYRLLLWGRGRRAANVVARARKMAQPRLLVVADERLAGERLSAGGAPAGRPVAFEDLAAAADAALVTASGPMAGLSVAACMAAALPIVSVTTAATAELLEDRYTALMVRDPKPRLLAEKVLALREDAGLRWKLADAARAEAYALWPLSAFMGRWRQVYSQAAAGGPVVLPDLIQP
jgi:glycosyltransferase involved in cell wall biosynthesis